MDKVITCSKCKIVLKEDFCKICNTDEVEFLPDEFLKDILNGQLRLAILIANDAHAKQLDKGGNPYILHPLAVMNLIKEDDYFFNMSCKIVAILHDVVEDTKITLRELSCEFSPYIIRSIDLISKKEGQSKKDYYREIKKNPIARVVKLADLTHNMDISRIKNPKEKDYQRLEVYKERYNYLLK